MSIFRHNFKKKLVFKSFFFIFLKITSDIIASCVILCTKYFDIMSLTAVYCQVDFLCESIPVKLLSTDTKFIVVQVNVRTTIRFFRVFSRQSVTYIHIQTYTLTHENICIQAYAISHCKILYRLFVSKAIS